MKCEEFLQAMEDYFDGELDPRAAGMMSAHINICADCARAYEELKREQEVYALYERDIEVNPAMWTAVRARIAEEKTERAASSSRRFREWLTGAFGVPRFSPALTAALILIAITVTAGVMRFADLRSEPGVTSGGDNMARIQTNRVERETAAQPAQPSESNTSEARASEVQPANDEIERDLSPSRNEREVVSRAVVRNNMTTARRRDVDISLSRQPTPEELVREAERTYQTAIAILAREVNSRRSGLDPELRERFERTLAAIDRTIAETRRAVRENPGDPVAARYMQVAYARKVEVLREMADY
jgi:hypothetical protein